MPAPGRPAKDVVHVALVRGINVGGRAMIAMADLRMIFEEAGAREVGTWIQSGNVIFRATRAEARRIPAAVATAIGDRLGLAVAVLMRTAGELDAVTKTNPFLRQGADPAMLHVMFLDEAPSPARLAALDPGRSPPDELAVRGREVFLLCPHGVARTRLTNAWFERTLATTATLRNWRTVLKLAALAAGGRPAPHPSPAPASSSIRKR